MQNNLEKVCAIKSNAVYLSQITTKNKVKMTIQELKDNREEVIETILMYTEKHNLKMVMQYLVDTMKPSWAFYLLESIVEDLVDELGVRKPLNSVELTYNGKTYYHLSDYQDAVNRDIRK